MNLPAIALWLALTFLHPVSPKCGEGTLRCNTLGQNPISEICDFLLHYQLNRDDMSCQIKKIDGCQFSPIDEDSKPCLLCEAGMVFDTEKTKCIAVADDKKREKCTRYDPADSACLSCEPDFYLSNGECLAVGDTKVDNCGVYQNDTDCMTCGSGYFLKEKKCVKYDPIPDCYSHSPRQCAKCGTGYFLNPGYSSLVIITKAFLKSLSSQVLSQPIYQTVSDMATDCQEVKTKYCAVPLDALNCTTCVSGFFLDDKKQCQRFPDQTIDHCDLYSNSTTCYRCGPNHFMADANVCTQVTPIQNCGVFVWNQDKCQSCTDGFLLLESGFCHERTLKTINNCSDLNVTKDQCQTCVSGFKLTLDFKGCFANVPNCDTQVDAVTPESLKHTCSLCLSEYYIESGFCKLKTVDNCKTYKTDSNTCQTCNDGFYLLSNTCLVTDIANCKAYEENTNRCQTCDDGYYQDVSKCLLQNVVNCKTYVTNSGACDTCDTNFYLSGDGKCLVHTVTGCDAFNQNTDICNACSANFWLDTGNNICHALTVTNCETYKTQSNQCEVCEDFYYFDDGANKCYRSSISNCKAYQKNSNDCVDCDDFFYLADKACQPVSKPQCNAYTGNSNSCTNCGKGYFALSGSCLKQNITHCITYTDNSNQCTSCAKGYYMKDSVCDVQSVDNCTTYTDNVNTCTGCKQGYYLQSTTCVEQDITNCKTYQSGLNNCSTCDDGYYSNADSSLCPQKDITGCAQYTSTNNVSRCALCENLKFLNGAATTCTSITNISNCHLSDKTTNACQECDPGFFFNSGVCSGTRDTSKLDSNCVSNTEIVTNSKCARCASGFSPITAGSPSVTSTFLSTNNCLKIDASSGVCTQCKDLYEFNVSSACVAAASPGTLKCKRMKNNHGATTLSENLKCVECTDRDVYFLETEVCKDRVDSLLVTDCGLFVKAEDKCLACKTGKIGREAWIFSTCQLTSGLTLAPPIINNCKIRENNDKCHACLQGYFLKADKTACESPATTANINQAFTIGMHSFGSMQDDTAKADNCVKYAQVDEDSLGCVKCAVNFVGIVPQPKSDNTDPYKIASHKDSQVGGRNYSNVFSECYATSQPYRINPNDKHVDDGKCGIGYRVPGKNGYACIRCLGDKRGRFVRITHDAGGAVLDSPIWGVGSCGTPGQLLSTFTNIDYKIFLKMHRLLFSTYMKFTDCGSNNLVYMMIIDLSDHFITFSQVTDGTSKQHKQAYCIDTTKLDAGVIANCSIYALTAELTAGISPGTDNFPNTHCIACKPGFKATIVGTSVTTCDSIPDCDSSTETWLDACEVATNDSWTSKSVDSMEIIAYDVPVPTPKIIANCLVVGVSEATPRCLMCKAGFKVENKNCVTTVVADSKCATRSIGTTDILVPQSLKRKRGTFNGFIYTRMNSNIGEFGANTGLGCNVCEENYTPRVDTTNLSRICAQHNNQAAIVQDCDNIDYNDFHICHDCQGALLISPIDHSCVDVSANSDCTELKIDPDNALNTVCKKCTQGKYLDEADWLCKESECEAYSADDDTECILCKPGKMVDGVSKVKCIDNDLVNDPCDSYSQKLNTCGRCATSSDFLYIIKTMNGSSLVHLGFECVTFALSGQGYGNYNLEYPYIEVVLDSSNNTLTSTVKGLMTLSQKNRTYTANPDDTDPAATNCVKSRPLTDCKSNSIMNGLFCTKCTDTYNVNKNNMCFPSSVDFCQVAFFATDGTNKCSECKNTHYLNSDGSACLIRSVSKFCLTFEASKDECLTCAADRFKNATKSCVAFTVQFCSTFKSDRDECATCQSGYYMDATDSDKCKLLTVVDCDEFKDDKNECDRCVANFLKDSGDLNKCKFYTANNCSAFNIAVDKCNTCVDNHYKDSGNLDICTQYSARNCLTFETSQDVCDDCKALHYKTDVNICTLYAAEHCDGFESDKDECTQCAVGYFKDTGDSNKCNLNTANNCQAKSLTVNECSGCLPFFYMDAGDTNKCKEYTAENCDTLADGVNECGNCQNLYFKDASDANKCKQNTASDCASLSQTQNLCATCVKDFFLDVTSASKCMPNSAAFCLEKSLLKNECTSCKTGFLKKTSGGGIVTCELYAAVNCNGFESDKDECTNCQPGFWKQTSGETTICTQRNNSNCNGFEVSLDECTSCNQGAFLVSGECKHVSLVINCKTYSTTEDKCLVCVDRFFKDPSNNECWPFPNGVKNCLQYISSTECSVCSALYFYDKSNNFCVLIETPIANCLVHEKADTCIVCKPGHILVNNNCVTPTAANCAEYLDAAKCKTCNTNHVFDPALSTCTPSEISNCSEAEKGDTKNLCTKCAKGYLLPENRETCNAPETAIDGCIDYETAIKCKECSPNKLLGLEGISCTDLGDTAGAQCIEGVTATSLICEVCSPGSQRDGAGKCKKVDVQNCLIPADDNVKCELCITGNYMNESGICTEFQAEVIPQSVHIFRFSLIISMIFLALS